MDIEALALALEEGRLAGAGVDVLPVEPPDKNMPLVELWRRENGSPINLILTPHTAFYSAAGMLEMRVKAAREIGRALRNERLENCVNGPWLDKELRNRLLVGAAPII